MNHLLRNQITTMAWRNIARRPRRSLLSIIAIGMASFSVVCLLSLVSGLRVDLAANLQRFESGQIIVEDQALFKAGGHALALSLFEVTELIAQLESIPQVMAVSPRVAAAASVFVEGDAVYFPFLGMDFATDPMKLGEFLLPGGSLPVEGDRQALISTGLADKLGLKVGDPLTAVTQTLRGSSNGMTFTITGIVHPNLGAYQTPWLFTSIDTSRRFVHLGDGASSLLVSLPPGLDLPSTARQFQSVLKDAGHDTATARPWFEASASCGLLEVTQVMYAFISLLFAALASTVVINTMLMVVLERSKEIGMLGALGIDQKTIRNLFLIEGAILSGAGAAAGAVAGSVVSLILGVTGLDYGEAMKGVQIEVTSVVRPHWDLMLTLGVLVMCTAVALVFTLIPLAKLKSMPIVDAMRGEV